MALALEALGPLPRGDGWGLVYRLYEACVRPFPIPRALVRYTLAGASLRAARAFFHRACIFETLHVIPMALRLALSVTRLAWVEDYTRYVDAGSSRRSWRSS